MARFDVYANPGPHANTTPYLLDVQSNLLDGLDSRMVIPLRRLADFAKVNIPNGCRVDLKFVAFNYDSGRGQSNPTDFAA